MGEISRPYQDRVTQELSFLTMKQRSRTIPEIAELIGSRITKGWAFSGVSAEQHGLAMEAIKEELTIQGLELNGK